MHAPPSLLVKNSFSNVSTQLWNCPSSSEGLQQGGSRGKDLDQGHTAVPQLLPKPLSQEDRGALVPVLGRAQILVRRDTNNIYTTQPQSVSEDQGRANWASEGQCEPVIVRLPPRGHALGWEELGGPIDPPPSQELYLREAGWHGGKAFWIQLPERLNNKVKRKVMTRHLVCTCMLSCFSHV